MRYWIFLICISFHYLAWKPLLFLEVNFCVSCILPQLHPLWSHSRSILYIGPILWHFLAGRFVIYPSPTKTFSKSLKHIRSFLWVPSSLFPHKPHRSLHTPVQMSSVCTGKRGVPSQNLIYTTLPPFSLSSSPVWEWRHLRVVVFFSLHGFQIFYSVAYL